METPISQGQMYARILFQGGGKPGPHTGKSEIYVGDAWLSP